MILYHVGNRIEKNSKTENMEKEGERDAMGIEYIMLIMWNERIMISLVCGHSPIIPTKFSAINVRSGIVKTTFIIFSLLTQTTVGIAER